MIIIELELYDYSPIVDRSPRKWPNGKRVAFYVGINIEHFQLGKRAISISAGSADLHSMLGGAVSAGEFARMAIDQYE